MTQSHTLLLGKELSLIAYPKVRHSFLLLGYPLLLSPAEFRLLSSVINSDLNARTSATLSALTKIPASQIAVLVTRINRKAIVISGRKLILGKSHHGYQLNPYL